MYCRYVTLYIFELTMPLFSSKHTAHHRLCDNIVFCPSNNINVETASDEEIASAFDPIEQGNPKYNNNEYALGFFAAIAVQADDVSLFLNGYSIAQCREHALMQRFFSALL